MELPVNKNEPLVMHIDLNSCFATVEQQANPLYRNKPVGVAAYTGPSGCIISPSYEAKRMGVKVGMRVRDARLICPDIIIIPPDPPKYRAVHQLFSKIFKDYSPNVVPKSIDEAVIDFEGTPALQRGLVNIGMEIKQRMKDEIGEWITCNVGIGTNRFLAKTAASLHKPDGLDVITHKNLLEIYRSLELIDLCGINVRYQARLNARKIYTPEEFLNAPIDTLKKQVFQSVVGYYWYLRLRGYEIDQVEWDRKSYGQSYALHKFTNDKKEIAPLLMKLCEKMGRRLRRSNSTAGGIHVFCGYDDGSYWHKGRLVSSRLYTTQELFKEALYTYNKTQHKPITHIAVSCYQLQSTDKEQLGLFDEGVDERRSVTNKMDYVNDRYGEYVVIPALMMGLGDQIIDRVPFGGVREIEEIYESINVDSISPQ